jgi:hypothetical protein
VAATCSWGSSTSGTWSRSRAPGSRASEAELEKVRASVTVGRLEKESEIGVRVGKVIGRFKVPKPFRLEIADGRFTFERDREHIDAEAALDGIYVVRSGVEQDKLSAPTSCSPAWSGPSEP